MQPDGSLRGFNNDGNGFVQSVRDAVPDWQPASGPIVVLGAGGAARAVVASLAAQGAREIRVVNRTLERARQMADEYGPPGRRRCRGSSARTCCPTSRCWPTAPTRAWPASRRSTSRSTGCTRSAIVGDLIYTPPVTPLLAAAAARGNRTVNGLGLLLNQARPAFHAWFGVMPEITPALVAAIEATF